VLKRHIKDFVFNVGYLEALVYVIELRKEHSRDCPIQNVLPM
jgi:hypothetical protein